MSKPPVFLRDATGLTRPFGALDALVMSTSVALPGYIGYAFQLAFVGPTVPGADITRSRAY